MKKNKTKKISILISTLVIIVAIVTYSLITLFKGINLGLDLQGGFEVLYEVKSLDNSKLTSDMLTSTYKTISRRIDVLGVSEPDISIEGNNKIRIKLAGISDPKTARNTISTTANITFRNTSDQLLMNSDVLSGAKVSRNSKDGLPVVSLSVKDKEQFYKVTSSISQQENKTIVIWLDYDAAADKYETEKNKCGSLSSSRCISAATVKQGFSSDVYIEGNFTEEEATSLAELINSGSMPTKLNEISSREVAASFGVDSFGKTLTAGIAGIAVIILLMVVIYRVSGLISGISMLIYTFIVFFIFYLIGGVLTLPGIAANILGIGMALDACIISLERIKDELKVGRSLTSAFKEGNKRSFVTILDSNITALLVAIILFTFGESSVKGFATMLIINIIVTIVSMVYINRLILNNFIKTNKFNNKLKLLFGMNVNDIKPIESVKLSELNKATKVKFDFVKNRKWFLITSSLIVIIGCIYTYFNGFNLSIEYKGGSNITVVSDNKLNINNIKSDLQRYKINDINRIDDNNIYIKVDKELTKEEIQTISNTLDTKYAAKTDVGVVSNIVKQELTKNAILSVIFASIGIVVYITFRFTFNYGFSAVIALLHDVLFVMAIFSLFRIEVSTIFIAAILSIIGYSINDTIVTFDRIRENIKKLFENKVPNKKELADIVNLSIRQTVFRSVITAVVTIIPVIMLLIFGTYQIYTFNIAMLIGLVVGVYSSVFIASQIWIEIEKRHVGKERKKKRFFEIEDDELDEKVIKGINR